MQLKFLPSVLMERENRFPFLMGSKKREKNKAIRENENLSAAQVLEDGKIYVWQWEERREEMAPFVLC